MTMRIVEERRVGPPLGSVPSTTIPLTFLDIHWTIARPVQVLFFYNFPFSTPEFTSATLPALRNSLSLALQRFFPLAGCIVFSPHQKPHLIYADGDSVPFTAFESHMDFDHLTGDHARRARDLQALVPASLPAAREREGSVMDQPVLAVQVTVFPNYGISIGVTFCHVAADGRSLSHFMKSWASIYRSTIDPSRVHDIYLPDHSRDSISDPHDIASTFLKETWQLRSSVADSQERIRVTFVVNQSQVERLKDWITKKYKEEKSSSQSSLRISTFVVTSALMWTCLVKSKQNDSGHGSSVDGDPICHFIFVADCREKLKLPPNYFGNCIEPRFAAAKRSELVGEKGIVEAAKAIGREISEFEKGALKGAEKWLAVLKEVFGMGHAVGVSGSPKLKVYETDFGWGRPRKRELPHLGFFGSTSITESRESCGGVEFGLVLSAQELDRFGAVFRGTLLKLAGH